MSAPLKNPLHLYRALLRETSYLFHPKLQNFHAQQIRWSFRRQLKPQKTISHGSEPAPSDPTLIVQDVTQQLRRGRQHLYTLQRANQGYVGAMENVLKMAYARKGRRRRELMKEIMIPDSAGQDPGMDSKSVVVAIPFSKDWKPPEKFNMLLRKQKAIHRYLDRGATIASIPKIPEKNRSGKPFPLSRVKTLMKTWYAKSADLLLPPLSDEEWMEVYKIGIGQASGQDINVPSRRKRGTVGVLTHEETDDQVVVGLDDLVVGSGSLTKPKYLYKVQQMMGNPHKMTDRFIRRLMLRTVINNTPVIVTDTETGRVAPRWDAAGIRLTGPVKLNESQSLSMFD